MTKNVKMQNISIEISGFVLFVLVCVAGHKAFGYNYGVIDIVITMAGTLFLLPFYAFPPIVAIFLARRFTNIISQVIITATSVGYGVWFAYLYYDAFYVHLDPQSGLVFVFVGIYALPGLLPLWLIAFVIERLQTKATT